METDEITDVLLQLSNTEIDNGVLIFINSNNESKN